MPDIGNPAGFDVATVLTGSGLSLLRSAAITAYGSRLQYGPATLDGIAGGVLLGTGVVLGLVLVLTGNR